MSKIIFENDPVIYTTGAFLKPIKVTVSNGTEQWLWFVSEFVDDSFFDGKVYNPNEFASSKEELLLVSEES